MLTEHAPFDVIMDKSTSDSISTSENYTASSQEEVSTSCPIVTEILISNPDATLSPVELLALQLVPLTEKGSIWIVLSYSTMRFDGFEYMTAYWTIRHRKALKASPGVSSSIHLPEVFHWLYILERN